MIATLEDLKRAVDELLARGIHPLTPIDFERHGISLAREFRLEEDRGHIVIRLEQ